MSQPDPRPSAEDKPEVEAVKVRTLDEVPYHEARDRAETASSLAKWLVVVLGASLATHYLLTVLLALNGKEEAIKNLNSIFNAWLPAISSLVSAAATYYFTHDKD